MRLVVAREVEDRLEKVGETVASTDAGDIHGAAELGVVVEDLDVDVVALHDGSCLHGLVDRAVEVVGAATLVVAVESGLHALVTGSEDLEDVELTAAGGPARALGVTVLESAGNLSVEHPDGGHVCVRAACSTIHGHFKFKHEDLLGAIPTVCRGDVNEILVK